MKQSLYILFFLIFSVSSFSQTETFKLEDSGITSAEHESGNGTVKITQDIRLRQIIKRHIEISNNKFDGWRVQIYFGSGQKAMAAAQNAKRKFLIRYGNKNGAYIVYDSPFFKVRVGDFRTKAEAMYFKSQIENTFPQSWVIPDKVYYPIESVE
ncbi:MAG: SPOR domain-containing protein [Bacteroidales bacterium]|nr:SPOR domain-containing protein [Bacteroidales bacterium]